jgi:ribosomal protein S6--L-glutamate ligase
MFIGILTFRNHKYHPNRRLLEAGAELGHEVALIHPEQSMSEIDRGRLGIETRMQKGEPGAILPRIGATINEYALTMVRHFELAGFPVINGFQSILLARNKFFSLQSLAHQGIAVPDSHIVNNFKSFEKAVAKLGGYPVVVKTLNSRQGKGVILAEFSRTSEFIVDNVLNKRQGLMVQEFISPQARRDIRAFVLGSQVIAAMELTPKNGDFRSNIHLKGQGSPVTLSKELEVLAIRSTKALGLEISGTDIIVDGHGVARVIEVNYSPGFRGLEASTGLDIAAQIIRYVVENHGGDHAHSLSNG